MSEPDHLRDFTRRLFGRGHLNEAPTSPGDSTPDPDEDMRALVRDLFTTTDSEEYRA